ncbi:unnamed protein product [Ectocarpus sp. CCAP 1310/34]|nr:unnamed protein product [Ectocarpus sp. CCAP 1310/34]
MMQRSSSAPQPADRRHAGTSASSAGLFYTGPDPGLPTPLVFTPVMLRRHFSCSASSGGPTSPLSAQSAATAAPASTASSPAPALWENLKSPTISFGTFRRESFGLGVRPEPSLSIEMRQVPEPSPLSTERVPSPPAPPEPVSVGDSNPRPKAEEKEDAKEESAYSNKVPGTGPGACMVCLEDCDNVLGSAWLHPLAASASASDVEGTNCTVTACVSCLKTYFTGIVEAGFDGACPRMRCMCCPRVVCEWVWAPLVEATVLETFQKRAATLLSIQCGMCHSRGTIMVKPPADHCYSSALDKLMTMIASGLAPAESPAATTATAITTQDSPADIESSTNGDDKSVASSTCNAQRMERFRASLERYIAGYEIDPSPCYIALEAAIGNPGIGQAAQESRDELMVLLMSCVVDSERRANLHIRFIRSNPMIVTRCCKSLHCYPCRVVGGHYPQTCEQYEAGRGHQDVCKCPGCGVYVVKGDGCDSISCVCGHYFNWSELVAARRTRIADAFRDAHPEDTGRAAAQIIRRGPPTAAELGAGPQEDINEHVGAHGDIEAQQHQGHEYPLDAPAATAAGIEGGESEQEEDGEEGQPATGGAWGEPVGHRDPVEDGGAWGQRWVPGVEHGPGAGADAGQPNQEPVQELERAPLHRTGQGIVEEERDEPFPVPGENGRLSAEDEFRLANAYAEAYPRELARGRAVIYREENPHFTVQRARAQSNQLPPLLALSYFRQPRPAISTSETEAAWLTRAAEDWLTTNQDEVNAVRRSDEAARSSLVEAFYSGEDLLRLIAAEYARSALRVAAPFTSVAATDRPRAFWSRLEQYQEQQADGEQNGEPLFKWLGIVEPPPPTGDQSTWEEDDDGAVADEDAWEVPFANAEIEEETFEILPPPRTLFTPWPSARTGRVDLRRTPPSSRGRRRAPDPASRLVSATSTFGTLSLRAEVELWVAGSNIRQEGLRRLMAVQERELSEAWVALWGHRRRLDPVSKTWVDADSGDAAVRAAARRVVFLEAHPEQACQEQGAMMKAFIRRNGAEVLKAVEEADAELAAAWERMHDNRDDVDASHSSTTPPASTSPSAFDRAYAAYRKHIDTRASAALVANSLPPTCAASATLQLRRIDRMADAWESANHRRVCAQRFADHFSGAAGAEKAAQERESLLKRPRESRVAANEDAAAFGAVVALVVAPMLIGRASQMCECDMEAILSNAVDWVAFNGEAFEEELQRMEARLKLPPGTMAGKDGKNEGCSGGGMGRILDGCECKLESSVSSCSRLVACPIVTRRILRVPEPVCPECEDGSGVFGTDLFDLFA